MHSHCLVTGGSGFIGSHLCKALADRGEEVVTLVRDIRPSKWLDLALSNCVKVQGDLRNYKTLRRVLADYDVDRVFHLGASSVVKTAFKDPINVYESNVMGTVNVLEAARQIGVDKVLIYMTDKIFGEKLDASETDPIRASEPYATSKGAADLISESYAITYGMNVIRMRCCNVYGLDLYSNRIIPNTIRACIQGMQPIIFEGEEKSFRQYIYIDDAVEATMILEFFYVNGPYHICNPTLYTQSEIVSEILTHFPTIKPKYVQRTRPSGEIWQQSLEPSVFSSPRTVSRWTPQYSLKEGIRLTVEKFKEYLT